MASIRRSLVIAFGIATLSALGTGSALAVGSSLDGVQGLLRIHAANPAEPGYISGSIYGLYAREFYTGAESPRGVSEEVKFGAGMASVGYAPSQFVELSLRGTLETQFADPTGQGAGGEGLSKYGLGDISFNVKALFTPADQTRWMLGGEAFVASATGNKNALVGSWDSDGLDLGGRLNLTYAHVRPQADPSVRVHMNAGYLNRTGDFSEAARALTAVGGTIPRAVLHGDQFQYGMGLEVPAPRNWTFFTEWSGEYDVESEVAFSENPMRVTPGFRWSNRSRTFVWTTGYDISVASDESGPGWQLISGITLGNYAGPVSGSIFGVVRDAQTGNPVPNATVSVRNSDKRPVQTDAEGKFTTSIPQGYAVLELEAEGYDAKTRVVEIQARDKAELEFTMMPRAVYGSVQGKLTDAATGEPVSGEIRVAGESEWTKSDAKGAFQLDQVPQGRVQLETRAKNYQPQTVIAQVTAGETAKKSVSLEKDQSSLQGVLSGWVRDKKTGKNVQATVTARGKQTVTTTVDPVTGLYEAKLPAGQYTVTVSHPGYGNSVETIQIAESQSAEQNFDLAVLEKKMVLQGVFFDSGAATIKRESYTALEGAAKFLLDNSELAVVIEGHTDARGSFDGNLELSQRRADAVKKFLVVNYGIDPTRLGSKGVGPSEPIASNETAEGRALNRRIEFRVGDGAAKN
jgi:outer membrane protein OmpA-like peptidoglycan-associated protein